MLVHVNAGDGGFAHADARSPVPRDQATEELEEIGIVADEHDVLAVRVLIDQLLEVGIARSEIESRADFDLALVAQLVAHELGSLQCPLQGARDNHVRLDFQGSEKTAHQHALFFAFSDKAALRVELCALTRNTGVRMTHQVEIHSGGLALSGRSILRRQKGLPA